MGFLAALNDERLHRALEIIHSNQSNGLTLDGLAKQIGMSRSNLAARFKTAVGLSPMKYLSVWQLMQSQKLLESTNKPISIIAEESGYASEAAFSRAFKIFLGSHPVLYAGRLCNPEQSEEYLGKDVNERFHVVVICPFRPEQTPSQ